MSYSERGGEETMPTFSKYIFKKKGRRHLREFYVTWILSNAFIVPDKVLLLKACSKSSNKGTIKILEIQLQSTMKTEQQRL